MLRWATIKLRVLSTKSLRHTKAEDHPLDLVVPLLSSAVVPRRHHHRWVWVWVVPPGLLSHLEVLDRWVSEALLHLEWVVLFQCLLLLPVVWVVHHLADFLADPLLSHQMAWVPTAPLAALHFLLAGLGVYLQTMGLADLEVGLQTAVSPLAQEECIQTDLR